MKFDGHQESVKPHKRPGRTTYEATRSFAWSLAERVSVHTRGTIALTHRSSRSQLFSRDIARQRSNVGGADPLSFLSSQLGNKFASVQTRGLGGERIYRHPGQFFRNTTYNSVTDCMSFNFNQTAQNVQILLDQIHTTQIAGSAEHSGIKNKTPTTLREGRELSLATKRWLQAVQWPQSVQLPLATKRWLPAVQWPQSVQLPQSILLQPLMGSPRELIVRFPASQATRSGETRTHATERLFTLTKLARWETERTRVPGQNAGSVQTIIPNAHRHVLINRTDIRYLQEKSVRPQLSWASSSLVLVQDVSNERWLRTIMKERSFTEQRSVIEAQLVSEKRSGFLRSKQISVRPRSLADDFVFIPQTMHTDRSQFETKLFEKKLFASKRLTTPALSLAGDVKWNLQPASELILVRKEGASRAPSMDFVFAQAFRQKISEERVVKHLEQREIVELVRKEVKQSMTRVSPLREFTREDYAEISDHVYSAFMKRLTAEKERLGLR